MNRENLWVQAALIVVVILAVGEGAFILFANVISPSALQAEKDTAVANAAAATARASELNSANQILQSMVGANVDQTTLSSIESQLRTSPRDPAVATPVLGLYDQYVRDMQEKFPEGYTEAKNYATLPTYYLSTIRDKNKELADIKGQLAQMTRDVAAIRAEGQQQVAAANAARDDAIAKREEYKTQFDKIDAQLKDEKIAMSSKLESLQNELVTKLAEKDAALAKKDAEIKNRDLAIAELRKKMSVAEDRTFEGADGKIVSSSGSKVFIDLGSAHNLRRQTTFSVYEKGETRFGKVEPKAKIEVTNITGTSMAEAKITESTGTVLSGDVIQSPVFTPGDTIHFALAGLMDINGDTRSDQALLESIIRNNGGAVDSFVQPDGKLVGKITGQTRYLILGQRPDEKASQAFLEGYTNLLGQANALGVETISLGKFLDMMGQSRSAPVMSGAAAAR